MRSRGCGRRRGEWKREVDEGRGSGSGRGEEGEEEGHSFNWVMVLSIAGGGGSWQAGGWGRECLGCLTSPCPTHTPLPEPGWELSSLPALCPSSSAASLLVDVLTSLSEMALPP